MGNSITIGQQHYSWKVTTYAWLGLMECVIMNIVDPNEQLFIIVEGTDEEVYRPQNIRLWISFALNHGWYSTKRVYKVRKENHQLKITMRKHSLNEEEQISQKLAKKYYKEVSPLDKSELKYQFELLEDEIGLELPTILKQLYLYLGNGNFGPDYGFLRIYEDGQNNKMTILHAYQSIHDGTIKDWDWQLPKYYIPFLYWGSNIYSMIDGSTAEAEVYVLDENLKTDTNKWQDCVWKHRETLVQWLNKWSDDDDETGRELWLEMYKIKGLI